MVSEHCVKGWAESNEASPGSSVLKPECLNPILQHDRGVFVMVGEVRHSSEPRANDKNIEFGMLDQCRRSIRGVNPPWRHDLARIDGFDRYESCKSGGFGVFGPVWVGCRPNWLMITMLGRVGAFVAP